jgi:hypothetical protein
MFGSADKVEPVPQGFDDCWREGLIESPWIMRAEVVHYQCDPFRLVVMVRDRLQEQSPVCHGFPFRNLVNDCHAD